MRVKKTPNGAFFFYRVLELPVKDKGSVYLLLSCLCVKTSEPDVCDIRRNLSHMPIKWVRFKLSNYLFDKRSEYLL